MLGPKTTGFMVKHAGLEITNPTLTAQGNWIASCVVPKHLIRYLSGCANFRSGDHTQLRLRRMHRDTDAEGL